MSPFSNKELYIMNGGNKQYIGRDGFMDVYSATPAEEAEWAREVIANALFSIDNDKDSIRLKHSTDNLAFHNYPGLEALLIQKLDDENLAKQVVFANILWNRFQYPQSFDTILNNFKKHRATCLNEVFWALRDFKKNAAARQFLDDCLAGDDEELIAKANMSKGMWS